MLVLSENVGTLEGGLVLPPESGQLAGTGFFSGRHTVGGSVCADRDAARPGHGPAGFCVGLLSDLFRRAVVQATGAASDSRGRRHWDSGVLRNRSEEHTSELQYLMRTSSDEFSCK